MRRLLLLGLNHTTAPLEVRERIAFSPKQQADAVSRFHDRFPDAECVLVSTCNRVELYVARERHGWPRVEEMMDFLAGFHNTPIDAIKPHLYHKTEQDAVDHLFTVTASLDSMVLGETQILGQVRSAYDLARERHATGTLLNPLFQRAIAVGKQVLADTGLSEGRLSVASVAVDYARRIFDHFDDKTILTIGAGKMTTLALKHFGDLRPRRLLICNRDQVKAQALADEFHGVPVGYDNLDDHLVAADIVISSTGAPHPIIHRRQFDAGGLLKRRRYRPLFLIDIALPRDIEPAVGEIANVYLYNLDDLQQVVSSTQAQRRDAIEAARRIVAGHVDEFLVSHRAREMGPVIAHLQKRYHGLAQEELQRTLNKLPNLSPTDREQLEDLTRRIVNKLLHAPIQAIRNPGAHTVEGQYLHAMEKLFDLPPTDAGAADRRPDEDDA